ncbi:MAG: L-rhamnose mutarotase, partial [Spirochaetes bacterium]|nr:L-rhamnose mutarotase [Spirochaetota bacterium]
MERLALVYRVKPGKKDEYIKAHNEIWPEILKGLKEAGC